jgi:hypothetical protein
MSASPVYFPLGLLILLLKDSIPTPLILLAAMDIDIFDFLLVLRFDLMFSLLLLYVSSTRLTSNLPLSNPDSAKSFSSYNFTSSLRFLA